MAKATIITTNSDALSRAASAIASRDKKPSKNAILNDMATAIAGPGKDWGFIKNAPDGTYVQPGIEVPKVQGDASQTTLFAVVMDEREDWSREPSVYASRAELIAGLANDYRDLLQGINTDIAAAAEKVADAGGITWPEDEAEYEAAENPGSLTIYEYKVTAPTAGPAVWCLEIDSKDDFSWSTRLFSSKAAALAALAMHRKFFEADSNIDFDEVMRALDAHGEFDSSPNEDMLSDVDADHDEYFDRLDSAVRFSIREAQIEGLEVGRIVTTTDPSIEAERRDAKCEYVYLAGHHDGQYDGNNRDEGTFFKSQEAAEAWAREIGLNDDPDYHWRDDLYYARDCVITAEFLPQAWVNDYGVEADPEGDTVWQVYAHEIELDQPDLDHLHTSLNAPDWVKDWNGPFEVYITVEVPDNTAD